MKKKVPHKVGDIVKFMWLAEEKEGCIVSINDEAIRIKANGRIYPLLFDKRYSKSAYIIEDGN